MIIEFSKMKWLLAVFPNELNFKNISPSHLKLTCTQTMSDVANTFSTTIALGNVTMDANNINIQLIQQTHDMLQHRKQYISGSEQDVYIKILVK